MVQTEASHCFELQPLVVCDMLALLILGGPHITVSHAEHGSLDSQLILVLLDVVGHTKMNKENKPSFSPSGGGSYLTVEIRPAHTLLPK